jgi:hypothetical protein
VTHDTEFLKAAVYDFPSTLHIVIEPDRKANQAVAYPHPLSLLSGDFR